jgi:hypothetical protein
MSDEKLYQCNETELLWMARNQGLGHLRRGLPLETLVQIVAGEITPAAEHYSGTSATRATLQKFIWENIERTRSQLPGCDGKCSTFPCSDGRHAMCINGNEHVLR